MNMSHPKNNPFIVEGHSLYSQPPFFDGTNYTYWKQRMQFFLDAIDDGLCLVVVNGHHVPMKIEDGEVTVKEKNEWNEEVNYRAMHMLLYAIKPKEYMKLSFCSSANEVWNKLQMAYEGIGNTRLKRMDKLFRQYDCFKMREFESIEDMFRRFSHIINDLHALGRIYSNKELVQKVLSCLSSHWNDGVDTIRQSRYVEHMTYNQLRGNLITYEKYFMKREIKRTRSN